MSVRRAQEEIDSAEFSEWLALPLALQGVASPAEPAYPSPDQLEAKMTALFERHNRSIS